MLLLTYQKQSPLDARPVRFWYADGSHDCPYCCYGIQFPLTTCRNPACDTNFTAGSLQARREEQERRKRDEQERQKNHERAMQRIAEEKRARQEAEYVLYQEAKKEGYCLRCLITPWGSVKKIKHRKKCPKENS